MNLERGLSDAALLGGSLFTALVIVGTVYFAQGNGSAAMVAAAAASNNGGGWCGTPSGSSGDIQEQCKPGCEYQVSISSGGGSQVTVIKWPSTYPTDEQQKSLPPGQVTYTGLSGGLQSPQVCAKNADGSYPSFSSMNGNAGVMYTENGITAIGNGISSLFGGSSTPAPTPSLSSGISSDYSFYSSGNGTIPAGYGFDYGTTPANTADIDNPGNGINLGGTAGGLNAGYNPGDVVSSPINEESIAYSPPTSGTMNFTNMTQFGYGVSAPDAAEPSYVPPTTGTCMDDPTACGVLAQNAPAPSTLPPAPPDVSNLLDSEPAPPSAVGGTYSPPSMNDLEAQGLQQGLVPPRASLVDVPSPDIAAAVPQLNADVGGSFVAGEGVSTWATSDYTSVSSGTIFSGTQGDLLAIEEAAPAPEAPTDAGNSGSLLINSANAAVPGSSSGPIPSVPTGSQIIDLAHDAEIPIQQAGTILDDAWRAAVNKLPPF